jgi:outer membrane biosynthesis protein TonB
MATNYILPAWRVTAGAVLLALLAAGCKPPKPAEPTAITPAEQPAAPSLAPANVAPTPTPTPDAPPPTEPSPVPKPTAGSEPSIDSMHRAIPSAKISVPVDLRYQFDGEPLPNQPVTLHLAAVSRVTGKNLHIDVRQMNGVQLSSGPLEVQKTATSGVYRRQLSVTRAATGPDHLRVLVTMDMAEGNGFGYFTVPFASGNPPQKQELVKQR